MSTLDNHPETGLYLFCFARRDLTAALRARTADTGSPVLVRRFRAASAVISEVSLAEFCGPVAEKNLQELAWLAPRACRHEQVIEEVMRQSPVLPARFGTIFSTVARLEDFAERHAVAISNFLESVSGREEWAVKGLLDLAKAKQSAFSEALAARQLELAALLPGRRHLEEQRLRAESSKILRRRVNGVGRALKQVLREHASACVERRIAGESGEGAGVGVIFNWAFLLPANKVAKFQAQVDLANSEHGCGGIAFKLTGPWPPYSFAPSLSMENGP